jgi:hypothetical protein
MMTELGFRTGPNRYYVSFKLFGVKFMTDWYLSEAKAKRLQAILKKALPKTRISVDWMDCG